MSYQEIERRREEEKESLAQRRIKSYEATQLARREMAAFCARTREQDGFVTYPYTDFEMVDRLPILDKEECGC